MRGQQDLARDGIAALLALFLIGTAIVPPRAEALPGRRGTFSADGRQKVIIDTDIGDDIDDAFALALALRSPEFEILGVTTTFGETRERAKLVERYLTAVGRANIPIAAGVPTQPKTAFTQRAYADGGHFDPAAHPKAADFILDEIRRNPGQITLIAIGPLVNVGVALEKDPQTFRKLKRVVMMGGSIERGYDTATSNHTPPEPEWNIENDIPAAEKLFASGVPIYLMPLDATQLKLADAQRQALFHRHAQLTEVLSILYREWAQPTPTLYDPVAVAYALRPALCPAHPMDIQVDEKGFTRRVAGPPDANVCLQSDSRSFFDFYLNRVAGITPKEARDH